MMLLCACDSMETDESEYTDDQYEADVEETTEEEDTEIYDEDNPLEVTPENIDSIDPVGCYIRVTGEGDVYRTDEGEIYVNDFFSNCGVRLDLESADGIEYTIDAPSASAGDFEDTFSSYAPMVFSSADVEIDGVTYGPCFITLEGWFWSYENVDGEVREDRWNLDEAEVVDLVITEK